MKRIISFIASLCVASLCYAQTSTFSQLTAIDILVDADGIYAYDASESSSDNPKRATLTQLLAWLAANDIVLTGDWAFTAAVLELPNSATLPATCDVGDMYMDSDATSGQRFYLCESANTWVVQGASTSAGGSDTEVQFNDGGTAFGGDDDFVWNKTTQVLSLGLTTATTQLLLPLSNDAITPTLAFGDGDQGFYEESDDELRWGSAVNSIFGSEFTGSWGLRAANATATVPPLLPDRSDTDTGIGANTLDQLSLIAGGVEGLRLTEATTVSAQLPSYGSGSITGTDAFWLAVDASGNIIEEAAPAGSGDITGVGDCASGNCFGGASGTTLTFETAGAADITLDAASSAGGNALTLPDATDTLVGKATTDTLTNKTIDATNTVTVVESDISDLDHTATSITDGLIVEADLNEDSGTPTDEDILTYDSTGANFNWIAQSGVAAGTAAALAANGGNCAAGSYPLGVDAAGAIEDCTDASTEIDSIVATHTAVTDAHIDHPDTKAELEAQLSDVSDLAEADGDVFTGVHDFGGAGSLEAVNSATPTTDATGEFALDTTITDHQPLIQYFDGAENMTVIAIDTAELPATDDEIIKYDAATDKFVLEADATGAGSGAFSDAGDPIVQNTTGKDVHVGDGAGTLTGKLEVGGDADQPQVVIEGFSTQTDSTVIVQTDADVEVATIENSGLITTLVGLDAIGAIDMDYGSADVTDHTFTTDSTGTAEIVLPAGAIDSTEILDDTIVPGDVDETQDYSYAVLSGKQDRNNTAVDDDNCASEQGMWWYDTTDSAFEFCNASSGAPATIGGHGNGANCAAGEIPLGVDADGAVESCYEPAEADISDLDHTATAITDGLIIEPDLNEDSGTPTDEDVLTYDSTGTNFNWVAQSGLAAGTAAALAANGGNCAAGEIPLGVDAAGAVEGCYEPAEADISDLDHTATSITDGLIVEADLNEDSGTPTDADVLTFDSTGANFNWIAQSGVAAGTAAALAANGGNCAAGEYALGVDAAGAVESCTNATTEIDSAIATHTAVTDAHIDHPDTKAELEAQLSDVTDLAEADGDVFTGVHDFGGATSTELVNSATPTTDATGEVALDTTITDHQPLWQYFDGAENMTVIAIDTAELPATDNEIVKYDAATDKFVLEADATGAGSGAFSDAGDPIVQNTTTKEVHIGDGAGTLAGKLEVGGDADQPQFIVEGHSTQTDSLAIFQNDADAEVSTVDVTGLITTLVGLDAIGAVDMDYGSADVTDHTFTTDSTGTAEIVLPAGAIDSTEILDGTILEVDLDADEAAVDNDILTFDTTGANFSWQTPAELSLAASGSNSDITELTGLTTDLTVAQGGTGAGTFTDGGILLGSGTSAITVLGVATNGQIPIGDGATDPVLATITAVANETDVTNGAGSITIGIVTSPTLDGTNFSAIPTSALLTEVRSMYWDAWAISSDGTQCADPVEATINSGLKTATIICTDNDASIMEGKVIMPDGWDAGTITFELGYLQTAADTAVLNMDIAAACRGAGETWNNTFGTKVAIDDAAVTGSSGGDLTTSAAVTADGTCAAGDYLSWRLEVDATGTTTAMATVHFLGVKMEYTTQIGD